jgi:hypothetical protein
MHCSNRASPIIKKYLTALDGNVVEILPSDIDGLNHPGEFMTDCKKWGREL